MKRLLLTLLSAVLLAAAFPNYNLGILAWIALVPLLLALDGLSKGRAFLLAYLWGVLFWLGTVYWLVHVTAVGMVLLVLYLALYFGIFGLILSQSCILHTAYYILFLPSIWVLLEYLRSYFFSGFGWALLGYSQYLNLPIIQIADITGVYGVSFVLMAVNVALKEIICLWRNPARRKESLTAAAICVLMLLAVVSYGYQRLNKINQDKAFSSLKVSVVQGNIPQRLKWKPAAKDYIMQEYLALSRQAAQDKPDLLIWPEAALPAIIEQEPEFFEEARDFTDKAKIPLLLGAVTERNNVYYNSALLITGRDRQPRRYDKLHLVPFGEFIPLKPFLSFLETIVPIGDFSPGREYTVFTLHTISYILPTEPKFSVLICFEDLFPQLSRQFAAKGANLLINITNDGWFGKSAAPFQHLSASVLRAVENRLPVVRAANTGVSGFIAPSGKIISLVSDEKGENIFVKGYRSEKINLREAGLTFYTRRGDILVLICFLAGFYGIMRILRRKK